MIDSTCLSQSATTISSGKGCSTQIISPHVQLHYDHAVELQRLCVNDHGRELE